LILGLLGCVLGAIEYGLDQVSALAATGPVDAAAMEILVPRPPAAAMPAASTSNKQAIGAAAGNPLWAIPLNSLPATRGRPLFSPSRRPPPAIVAAPPAPPPPEPAPAGPPLTLVGTAVGGTRSIGVFVDQVTKKVIRLRTGEDHAGWMLRAIHGREAILEKDRREATLALQAADGTDREAASVEPRVLPPGMWLDGDGQIVSPPPSRTGYADGKLPAATWRDGDGQLISPPAAGTGYADGSPPPATWLDGDGQMVSPPLSRTGYADGKVPPATWRDGDGQLIAPPLTQVGQSAPY
jgi:general secretion pathway protein N